LRLRLDDKDTINGMMDE